MNVSYMNRVLRSYASFKLKQGILDKYSAEEILSWLKETIEPLVIVLDVITFV